jgi:hypothetical protein
MIGGKTNEGWQNDVTAPGDPTRETAAAETGEAVGTVMDGRYRLVEALGSGRAATVYLAEDQRVLGRRVAVKLAHAERRATPAQPARDHLAREARALALIRHPAVPSLADVFTVDERIALVLEYLPGRTLRAVTDSGPAPEEEALEWALRLCDVLTHLHGRRQPLVHGTVRTENCMLLPAGRLVLFDFGTAAEATDSTRLQDTLGVVLTLYHLLTGTHERRGPFPPIRAVVREVSEMTDRTVGKALQRPDQQQGPLTLGALRRQLGECRAALGVSSGICPYCQARTRPQARHCGACGSPLGGEMAAHGERGHPVQPRATLPAGARPAAQTAAQTGRTHEVAPIAEERAAPAKPAKSSYLMRLRILGHVIEQQGLSGVSIVEGADGFTVRGRRRGLPAEGSLISAAGRGHAVNLQVSEAALQAYGAQALQQRHKGEESPFVHTGGAPPSSTLFPTGYEDGLRALGYQLDARGGVRNLSIVESATSVFVDYELDAASAEGGAAHQHVALSATDMEAMLAEAVDRRGGG